MRGRAEPVLRSPAAEAASAVEAEPLAGPVAVAPVGRVAAELVARCRRHSFPVLHTLRHADLALISQASRVRAVRRIGW